MMHCDEQVIMKAGKIASLPVKEVMREVDTEEEESEWMTNNFKEKAKLVDKMERVSIKKHN